MILTIAMLFALALCLWVVCTGAESYWDLERKRAKVGWSRIVAGVIAIALVLGLWALLFR
jgi:hypothetical protein